MTEPAIDYSWVAVHGFGAHVKSTRESLVIQQKNGTRHYPLDSVKNLIIVGGHTISTATLSQLARKGAFVTFFDTDGIPTGMIRPYNTPSIPPAGTAPGQVSHHRYAVGLAESSMKSRLVAIESLQEAASSRLFLEGEQEVVYKAFEEVGYLVKLDEIQRIARLVSDMYYEIASRALSPAFGFRRRTSRPHTDPVNAMLSFGYSMLYGSCIVAIIGARLDPDAGILTAGPGGLVQDLIDPLKAKMVDRVVFDTAIRILQETDYEQASGRCILSENLARFLAESFRMSIDDGIVGEQVCGFRNSLWDTSSFRALY